MLGGAARGPMRAILLALLVLPVVPSAAADETCLPLGLPVTGCVYENSYSEGPCDEGGFETGGTGAYVSVPGTLFAGAGGSYYCYGGEGAFGGEDRVEAFAYTPVDGVHATWAEFYYGDPKFGEQRFCYVSAGVVQQACPDGLAPPNPGWGDLLP